MPDLAGRHSLIIVAAGGGARFGARKQFIPLRGVPLVRHCLLAFDRAALAAEMIVVLPGDALAESATLSHGLSTPLRLVAGGATRAESVLRGVEAASSAAEFVSVHDGARPFPPVAAARRALELLAGSHDLHGITVGTLVTDTLKVVAADADEPARILATADRTTFRRAETPQVARRASLARALVAPGANAVTDEMAALEALGLATALLVHDGFNLKITTPSDLARAEEFLSSGRTLPA